MVDAVTNGTAPVPGRATSSLWTVGNSAAFGAYALTHNLWARGVDVDGLVLDSGLLVERAVGTNGNEWVTDEEILAKHGPYVADRRRIDRAIADGFDVALFDTVEESDVRCRGSGAEDGCTWLHGGLARAISDNGDPSAQQVHVYPGSTHMATTQPGTQVQNDLRAWYRLVAHSRNTDRTDLSH